ncbi:3-oxoadipate enol-lactonase [Algihabitans albus]|uniref:3-oxoadipate enol-lactonase n=1 Tax=Algihabitans albus TaxID=2164067 RepID=UPI000E5D8E1B|nr:3-oxoadipate enol-lactonase [Algihabitans albus]
MQSALIDGRVIEYRIEGPGDGSNGGPVLVFSNSLGTDLRVWDALLPFLPAGLRILRYSKAGHGLSDLAGERPILAHAGDLLSLMNQLGIAKATLVGLSVGGMIAQSLAAAAPERVTGLVLCCTAQKIGTAEIWNERIAGIRAGGLESLADAVMERWFSPAFRETRAAELALWRNMLLRTPAKGYSALCAAIRDADLTAGTKSLSVPTLCVAGSVDGSTPPEVVRGLTDLIPGAGFEVIEGVGHIPCVEAPERLGHLISGVLKEHGLG